MKTVKLPKGVDESFINTLDSISTDEMKMLVVRLQAGIEEVQQMKESPGYLAAKEAWEQVDGPVRDTLAGIRNKTKLVIERLKDRGVV